MTLFGEYNKYVLRRIAMWLRHLMAAIRSALFALLFYPGTLLYVLSVIAVSPFGAAPVRSRGPRLVELSSLPRAPRAGHPDRMGRRNPARRLSRSPSSIRRWSRRSRRCGLADTPVVVMKRELTVHPVVRLGDAALWRHRRRPRGGRQGAARNARGRPRRRSPAGGRWSFFPKGREFPWRAPPLRAGFAGLYRALGLPVVPVARRQRADLAARLRQARGHDPLQGRRGHPAGAEARRSRGARPRRDQRARPP